MSTSKQPYAVAVGTQHQNRASADDPFLAGMGDHFSTQQYSYGPLELNTHTSNNNNNSTCPDLTRQANTYGVS